MTAHPILAVFVAAFLLGVLVGWGLGWRRGYIESDQDRQDWSEGLDDPRLGIEGRQMMEGGGHDEAD